jgi:hypothetical protein
MGNPAENGRTPDGLSFTSRSSATPSLFFAKSTRRQGGDFGLNTEYWPLSPSPLVSFVCFCKKSRFGIPNLDFGDGPTEARSTRRLRNQKTLLAFAAQR